MKILITIILVFVAGVSGFSQKWKPDFLLPLEPESAALNHTDLNTYLQANFDSHKYIGNCAAELSVFYFRVNYDGKIDSVYNEGNLNKDAITAENKNIYKTEGKWKIPAGTRPSDNCWFVYPYFIFGKNSACKENRDVLNSTFSLYQMLLLSKANEDIRGRVLLPPNPLASLSYK